MTGPVSLSECDACSYNPGPRSDQINFKLKSPVPRYQIAFELTQVHPRFSIDVLPDRSGVPLRGGHELERFEVPEVDASVLRGRGQQELVRVKLDVVHGPAVLVELRHQFASSQIPNLKKRE